MARLVQNTFWTLVRWLLHLRYRVDVSGLDKLKDLEGPTLILPNHPGYIDPPLVLSHVRPKATIRPLVYSGTYRNFLLYPVMRLVGAFEVPDLGSQSRDAQERTFGVIDAVVAGLKQGESFLIYPSGRLRRGDMEVIGAARAVADVLDRAPDVNIVLVRTQGVWGSMFSFARTGEMPDLGKRMVQSVLYGMASLLFFLPRRQIKMTVEVVNRSTLPSNDRTALNRKLEAWYNIYGPEKPVYVPYHRLFGPRDFDFPKRATGSEIDLDQVPQETRDAVQEIVEMHLGRDLSEEDRLPEATLDRVGLDSLARMDVALEIEDRFGFRSDHVATTIGELWALAAGIATGDDKTTEPAPVAWTDSANADDLGKIHAETIAEAFVRRALTNPSHVAVADQLSGVLTYRRLLVGASLMAKRLKKLEGDAVGIMLPASVAADLVFLALHLAGKLPVMMNWTTGPANLAHAVEKLKIRHVVTSKRFVDRLRIEVDGADYVYLEELRQDIGKLEAARTLLASHVLPGSFLKALPEQKPDDPAVVLFTSGSESVPKAVPLTHANLIANVRGGMDVLDLKPSDSLLGFLPPFHSFGMTGAILLPLLTGVRVLHSPDPTDASGLTRLAAAYRPSSVLATPTFLNYMLGAASGDELQSLRIIVTGAEKCPDSLFTRCEQVLPSAVILEGYGITECSPVVAGNRPGAIRRGTVGRPIDGVELSVVHPETHAPLPPHEPGLLLVRGPSVFSGYIKHDGPAPFVEVNNQHWYNTGDLVRIDEDGFIHFQGRLKRFIKAGGEMVSLPALEEPLALRYPATEDGPQVAVEGIETPDGRRIVLFCVPEITLRDANTILTEAGFRGVMRLDETRQIDSIPVLGTGKTDYKVLRKMIQDELAE